MEWSSDSCMILLSEVAEKLEKVLNGTDSDVIRLGLQPPTGYFFKVATEGFHLDRIYDMEEGKNFIPVFISSMGGNFNPVPELLQANYVIPIAIYFPVRFKNDLYSINEYLAKVFVGRQLYYGYHSGTALSNVSVAQYGEILEMDLLEQFKTWEETIYKMPIEVMEPMLQMNISLYLSTASEDFVYGNSASAELQIDVSNDDLAEYFDNDPDKTKDAISFVTQSVQSTSDPTPQQILGTNESESLPTGTAYASSFSIYIKDNEFYRYLIKKWFDGEAQTLTMTLSLNLLGQTYERTCFVQSVNLVVQKGELVTITFTFTKKVVLDNGGL